MSRALPFQHRHLDSSQQAKFCFDAGNKKGARGAFLVFADLA